MRVSPHWARNDAFRLKKMDHYLENPLEIPHEIQGMATMLFNANRGELLRLAIETLEVKVDGEKWKRKAGDDIKAWAKDLVELDSRNRDLVDKSAKLPADLQKPIFKAVWATTMANRALKKTFEALGNEDNQYLRENWKLLVTWVRGRENVREFDEKLLRILEKYRLQDNLNAAYNWYLSCLEVRGELKTFWESESFEEADLKGWLLDVKCGVGRVLITGSDSQKIVDGDAPAIHFDLGGDDVYVLPVAHGHERASLSIDLSGDDRHVVTQGNAIGSGMLGFGAFWDLQGRDRYDVGDRSLGASCLGIGFFHDEGGDDDYHSEEYGIGAGCFGVGLFIDDIGHDNYVSDRLAQGTSLTKGTGVLIDRKGQDTYLCGRKIYGWSTSRNMFSAEGQGYACGIRQYSSAGYGLLIEGQGNDSYYGNNLAQGAGYWFGLGALIDMAGNDQYRCVHYGQGLGVHAAIGLLIDKSGDDVYLGNVTTGGSGYDRSVGIFIDYRGNDYHRHGHLSGGSGQYISTGIFVDVSGNDVYRGGFGHQRTYGYANIRSHGICIDAGGDDTYVDRKMKDGQTWRMGMGVALDGKGKQPFSDKNLRPVFQKTKIRKWQPKSMPNINEMKGSDIDKLFEILSYYGYGQKEKKEARDVFNDLSPELTMPLLKEKLISRPWYWSQGTAYDLIPKAGGNAITAMVELTGDSDGENRRRGTLMLSYIDDEKTAPHLLKMLKDEFVMTRATAIRGLGSKKVVAAFDEILKNTSHENWVIRNESFRSLSRLCADLDEKKKDKLFAFLSDFDRITSRPDRWAAANCLGKLGDRGLAMLENFWNSKDPFKMKLAMIGWAGALEIDEKNDKVFDKFKACYKLPDPQIRVHAHILLTLLNKKKFDEHVNAMMKKENDPLLKSYVKNSLNIFKRARKKRQY